MVRVPVVVSLSIHRAEGASLGMVLGEGCVVRKVVAGLPASVAGVVVGMQITHVNGVATTTPQEAKLAGKGADVITVRGVVDSSARLHGRIVSWTQRGHGVVLPDAPVVIPAGVVTPTSTSRDPALHTGYLFCHISQCKKYAPSVGDSVEFSVSVSRRGLEATSVRRCNNPPSAVEVSRTGETKAVQSVSWWNVNNLSEIGRIVVKGDRFGKALRYSRNGVERPEVREVVLEEGELRFPEIGKTLRVPCVGSRDRVRLLGALREMAVLCGVRHNLPTEDECTAELAEPQARKEELCGSGGGAEGRTHWRGTMLARTTTELWIGYLPATLASRPARLRSTLTSMLAGHHIASIRCAKQAEGETKLAVIVTLKGTRGVSLMQVCELNMRERPGQVRVIIDDAGSRHTRV